MSYSERTFFSFQPDLSTGSENDMITNLWIPYLMANHTAGGEIALDLGTTQALVEQCVGIYQALQQAVHHDRTPIEWAQAAASQWGNLQGDPALGVPNGTSFVVCDSSHCDGFLAW